MAQFHWLYPGAFRDGAIPALLFWSLCRRMQNIFALRTVLEADAVMKGGGVIMSGDKALPLLNDLIQRAFPNG